METLEIIDRRRTIRRNVIVDVTKWKWNLTILKKEKYSKYLIN